MEDESINGAGVWPLRWQIDIAPQAPAEPALEAEDAARAALHHPLVLHPLSQLRPLPRQVVIACDALPVDPYRAALIQALLDDLNAAGVSPQQVTLLVASSDNTSPVPSPAAVPDLWAARLSTLHTVCHDPEDMRETDALGTYQGVPLAVNYRAVEADVLIALSVVRIDMPETHWGVYRLIGWGLASAAVRREMQHTRFYDDCVRMSGESPLTLTVLREASARTGMLFAVEALEDAQGHLIGVFAGQPEAVRSAVMRRIADLRESAVPESSYDVVVAAAVPGLPQNLYDATALALQQGLAPSSVLARGGSLIVPTNGQLGDDRAEAQAFYETLTNASAPEQVIQQLSGRTLRAGEDRAYLLAHLMGRHRVIVVGAEHEQLVRDSHLIPARTLTEALEIAELFAEDSRRALIVPQASVTLPVFSPFAGLWSNGKSAHLSAKREAPLPSPTLEL